MVDEIFPIGTIKEKEPVPLFSGQSLDALKHGFLEESSFAQIIMNLSGDDNFSVINNRLLEFRDQYSDLGQDGMGDRPSYDPMMDDKVISLPVEWHGILSNVQSPNERDLVIGMLQEQQSDKMDRINAGLPFYIGAMGGSLAGVSGVAAIATGGATLPTALGATVGGAVIDEAILRSTQPIRTNQETVASLGMGITGITTITLAQRLIRGMRTRTSSAEEEFLAIEHVKEMNVARGEKGSAKNPPLKIQKEAEGEPQPQPVGAAVSPEPFRIRPQDEPYVTFDIIGDSFAPSYNKGYGERLVKTWVGLEKIGDNPLKRILMGESNYLRQMIGHLVESPYFQLKNVGGSASSVGIDRIVNSRWLGQRLVPAMRETESIYAEYRARVAGDAQKGFLRQKGMDVLRGGSGDALSPDEFLEEVTKAKRRLGEAEEANFPPEVLRVAALWDKNIFVPLANEAKNLRMFSILPRRELARTERDLSSAIHEKATQSKRMTPDAIRALDEQIDKLKVKVADLQKRIMEADNLQIKDNFVNRLYRRDYMDTPEGKAHWYEVLARHGYSKENAEAARMGIMGEVPYSKIETDPVGVARSLRERTLSDIDDIALEPFLENNMFALGRYYAMRMGTDVEMTRKFGSIDLLPHFDRVRAEFNMRRANVKKGEDQSISIAELNAAEKQALEDLTVLRDRARGTYGLPDNPDSWTNRGMRMARGFNAMTMLTGAMAAVPDLGRLAMHDGFGRLFGTLHEALANNMKLLKLGKADANLAGEALDDYLSLRAALFADLGESISVRHPMERAMGNATQMFFNVSLMNQWNVGVKTLAGLIAGSKMIDDIAIVAKGSKRGQKGSSTRLARAGIDSKMAKEIHSEIEQHALKQTYTRIARTHLWKNKRAAELYQAALGKEINTIIVTPGIGDLPSTIGGGLRNLVPEGVRSRTKEFAEGLENPIAQKGAEIVESIFVSPELSRMVFQFKSFGIAATQRILIPGLQHMDKSTLTGATMLIGLGIMVDQIRRDQNDVRMPQSTGDVLMRGIERSGILGYFSDIGRAIENFSNPLSRPGRAIQQLGGPFVHQLSDLSDVVYDYSGLGNINKTTNAHVRDLVLLSNVAHLDWLMDMGERGLNQLTLGKD